MTSKVVDRGSADRVLLTTRILSAVIVPFLVTAFVILYFWPSAADTGRLFAWPIAPPIMPMILASAYLGGAFFFVRATTATRWHEIRGGFAPVALFATLMGVATIIHWDRFSHGNVAFWVWAGLYFTTPFLVVGAWWRNQRVPSPRADRELVISAPIAVITGFAGGVALLTGLVMFAVPSTAIDVWPWSLTELTSRVSGAIVVLGSAGLGAFLDRRWSSARLLFQVFFVMAGLMLVGAIRAASDLRTERPMTWILVIGFPAVVAAAAVLYARMEVRRRRWN